MYVRLDGRDVRDVKLRIYEPPRFFEAFLRGRAFTEVPDITARICGICPVAYQMSAVRAMEDACGVAIDDGPIRDLRRLIYCGEWIESHSLHVYMLHAPDFLGYPGAIEMAADYREIVEQGLQMKKAGNALVATVGGREVHPVNVRVGGFYRAPTRGGAAGRSSTRSRGRGRPRSRRSRWAATLPFPDVEHRTRARRAARPDRLPDRPRADRLRPRARHRARGVRRPRGRGARRALDRAARPPARARQLPHGPARALQPRDRMRCARSRATRPVTPVSAPPAATRSRASSSAPSSSSRRPTRRSRSSPPTTSRTPRPSRSSPAGPSATARPRRRAACSTTATRSTTPARSSMPGSSRRPRRTSARSRRICAPSSSATSTCPTTSSRSAASRRSATTIRASPARRTSSS